MDYLNLNTARAILVAGAALTLLIALLVRQWVVAGIFGVGIAAHGLLWVYLRSSSSAQDLPGGAGEAPTDRA